MGKVKCKRAMRRITNGSEVLTVIECECKFPRNTVKIYAKEKAQTPRIRIKTRAVSFNEMCKIMDVCLIAAPVAKIPAFKAGQAEEKLKVLRNYARFLKAKNRRTGYAPAEVA